MSKRDLDFLYEIGTLRNMQRGWAQHIAIPTASVAEHIFRVAFLATIICRMEKQGDENKIIKMALAHDIGETRTSDLSYVQKVYVEEDDDRAARDTFTGTTLENFYTDIIKEFEERKTIEAKIVKDADNLDIDLEQKELVANGFEMPPRWHEFRELVRNEKLYTESAKKIWDEIQNSNIHDWHVAANKWLHVPGAGK